jgi:hypothetical protein
MVIQGTDVRLEEGAEDPLEEALGIVGAVAASLHALHFQSFGIFLTCIQYLFLYSSTGYRLGFLGSRIIIRDTGGRHTLHLEEAGGSADAIASCGRMDI